MGRRKCLSPTSAVAATTLLRLPGLLVFADGTLDHLGSLRIDHMLEVSTTLLERHLAIV